MPLDQLVKCSLLRLHYLNWVVKMTKGFQKKRFDACCIWGWWGPFLSAWSPPTAYLRISPVPFLLCRFITAGSCSSKEEGEKGKRAKVSSYPGPIGAATAARETSVISTWTQGILSSARTYGQSTAFPSIGRGEGWYCSKIWVKAATRQAWYTCSNTTASYLGESMASLHMTVPPQ